MRLIAPVSLAAFLGLMAQAQAELRCKCDHIPIEPKQCVNLCFGALLNTLPQERIASLLDLDAQLSNSIAVAKNAGPIKTLSDLRSQLSKEDFEQLESKVAAAAAGNTRERAALKVQLAALPSETRAPAHTSPFTEEQIAAIHDEAETERPPSTYSTGTYDSTTETTGSAASSSSSLPKTASDLPLLGLIGAISLAASLALRGCRKRNTFERNRLARGL